MSPEGALKSVAALFARPIHVLDGAVLMSDLAEARRHLGDFPGDLTALEAFVSHVHLEDAVAGLEIPARTRRRRLLELGEALVQVWAERLVVHLQGRPVLFYLGGPGDVSLRFHVERADAPPWFPFEDEADVRKQRLRVYRAVDGRVERIAG